MLGAPKRPAGAAVFLPLLTLNGTCTGQWGPRSGWGGDAPRRRLHGLLSPATSCPRRGRTRWGSEVAGPGGRSISGSRGPCVLSPKWLHPLSPLNGAQAFPLLHTLSGACYLCFLDTGPSDRYELIAHWGSDLLFPGD